MTARCCPVALLCLVTVLLPSAAASQDARRRAVHHTVLENGLEVVVVENHAVPLATALVAVRTGAFTQAPGEAGLAHLHEHVIFRAFKNSPSAFAQEVAALNGMYNGSTAEEFMTFFVVVPSENLDKAVGLLGELIPRARLGPLDLTDERPVVLDELAREQSDPDAALERRVGQALWDDAWHRRDVIGDSVSLESVTLDRLKETLATYYVPNNTALIVTGDVSSAEVFAAAERYFGKWTRGTDPFAGPAPVPFEPLGNHRITLLAEPVSDVSIVVAVPGPGVRADTADTYAADALLATLNDPTSPFQERLVTSGLFQRLDAQYHALSDVGWITFSGKTTPERARQAAGALIDALDQPAVLLAMAEEDLAVTHKQQALQSALALEATATLAPSLAHWWATGGIDYYLTYEERLSGQSPEDMRRLAERFILNRPRAIGLLGPPEVIEGVAAYVRQITLGTP